VSKSLLIEAVQQFVKFLKDPGCDKRPGTDTYSAVIETSEGVATFSDESRALLFRAFSVIEEIDPQFAGQLRRENDDLAKAGAPILQAASTFVPVNASAEERAQREKIGLQQALMRGIPGVLDSNPYAALQMADSIKDPVAHAAAVASVLPSLADRDMGAAKQRYEQELDGLNSLPDTAAKAEEVRWRFDAMVGLTKTAFKSGDMDNFEYLAAKLLANGVQAFEADYAAMGDSARRPADARLGYRALGDLVEFAAAHNIAWLLDEAGQIDNPRLKVHLKMFIAEGLSHRK